MRFVDFLKSAVLLFVGSANALALVTLLTADAAADRVLLFAAFAWWLAAAGAGMVLGRRDRAFVPLERLMATARATPALPELEPGTVLFNRLWGLAAFTLVAGAVGFVLPHVPAVAVGFPLMAALALRKQALVVQAVEDRDGVRFYLDRTSPVRPTRLVRTPGFKKWVDDEELTGQQAGR